MTLSVYDIINRVKSMQMIVNAIDDDKPIEEYRNFIYQMCDEYSELLQGTKVKF